MLTGYGSDLLIMGLPLNTDWPEEIVKKVVDGIDDVRHSSEFTGSVIKSRGIRVGHSYWHPEVVHAGINIHPSCKVREGRNKWFFRSAIGPFVPFSTAWKKKSEFTKAVVFKVGSTLYLEVVMRRLRL